MRVDLLALTAQFSKPFEIEMRCIQKCMDSWQASDVHVEKMT